MESKVSNYIESTAPELLEKLNEYNKVIRKVFNDFSASVNICKLYHSSLTTCKLYVLACEYGHLEVIKWLLENDQDINILMLNELFRYSCKKGQLEIAKLLVTIRPYIDITGNFRGFYCPFYAVCQGGHLEVAKWLLSQLDCDLPDDYVKLMFLIICRYGQVNIAKWLLEIKPNIDVLQYNNFMQACCHDQLHMVKWLVEIKPELLILVDENIFNKVCQYGHLNIAKWLIEIKPELSILINRQLLYDVCTKYGQVNIAEWLLEMKPDFMGLITEFVFSEVCKRGFLSIAQWILKVKPNVDISYSRDIVFRYACERGSLEIAKWLTTIKPNYKIIIRNNRTTYQILRELPINSTIKISLDTINEDNKICPICYDPQVKLQTNCKHNFCTECIAMHYNTKNNCPYCRELLNTFYFIE